MPLNNIKKPVILYKRHIVKSITWRVFSFFTTYFLVLLIFHKEENAADIASGIAIGEFFFKMVLYLAHERIWYHINFDFDIVSRVRHIAKSITWRILGSFVTFALALFFNKNHPEMTTMATKVVVAELFLKVIVYYWHERIWYHIKYGVIHQKPD
jgi:uncharacterized membrane protein